MIRNTKKIDKKLLNRVQIVKDDGHIGNNKTKKKSKKKVVH